MSHSLIVNTRTYIITFWRESCRRQVCQSVFLSHFVCLSVCLCVCVCVYAAAAAAANCDATILLSTHQQQVARASVASQHTSTHHTDLRVFPQRTHVMHAWRRAHRLHIDSQQSYRLSASFVLLDSRFRISPSLSNRIGIVRYESKLRRSLV